MDRAPCLDEEHRPTANVHLRIVFFVIAAIAGW